MNRSGVSKNTRKNNNKDKFNPRSNPIIAQHWDNELTAKQNYKKLGLTFRIGGATGGEEKKIKIKKINHGNMEESLFGDHEEENDNDDDDDELDPYDPTNILEGTAKFLKDDDGKIIKIIYGTKKIGSGSINSKKDNTEKEEEEEEEEEDSGEDDKEEAKIVIAKLEAIANIPKKKEVHRLNELEVYRYGKLIEKYGDDYEKMKWDKKLNPFQLSPGQLRKQIKRYHEFHSN
jgi:nucleolar protein 16